MNRWLIPATLVFALGMYFLAAHEAKASEPPPLPADGLIVSITGESGRTGPSVALMRETPRIGDPDSANFDGECRLSAPCEIKVLGSFSDAGSDVTIVALYASAAKPLSGLSCGDQGIILLSPRAWQELKAIQAEEARLQAAAQRRRQAVRDVINAARPAPAKEIKK